MGKTFCCCQILSHFEGNKLEWKNHENRRSNDHQVLRQVLIHVVTTAMLIQLHLTSEHCFF